MNPYATKLAEAFSAKLLEQVYERSIAPLITNSDYQGDVQQGSKVNVSALARLAEKSYTGANLTPDDLQEIVAVLDVDQARSFYFRVRTIDEYKSFIKDPKNKTIRQRADERKKNVDSFVLSFWGDVAAGNRVGTDYTTGTVAVAATTGVVTGTGTTFTSGMVGRGFRAAGHVDASGNPVWYRVKTFTSATSITIEDDLDDEVGAYTGGAISAGSTYVIEATTPIVLTAANVLATLLNLKQKLDDREVPDEDRFLVIPSVIENIIVRAEGVNVSVPAQYESLVRKGFITELAGFKLLRSARVAGNNTAGYRCVGGTPDWLTFADKVLEAGIEEDLIGNFGAAFKDLYVYGAKVADERRKFGIELFARV